MSIFTIFALFFFLVLIGLSALILVKRFKGSSSSKKSDSKDSKDSSGNFGKAIPWIGGCALLALFAGLYVGVTPFRELIDEERVAAEKRRSGSPNCKRISKRQRQKQKQQPQQKQQRPPSPSHENLKRYTGVQIVQDDDQDQWLI